MNRERLKVIYSKAAADSKDPFWLKVLKFIARVLLFIIPLLLKRKQ